MDLTKFVRLLQTSSIFFARADRLGDPFEGSNTFAAAKIYSEQQSDETLKQLFTAFEPDQARSIIKDLQKYRRQAVSSTYISCWHASIVESAAMWSLYGGGNGAIAVRARYGRLASALPSGVFMGEVRYVDWNSHMFDQANTLAAFLAKRLSYSHEHEVRAVIQRDLWDGKERSLNIKFSDYGADLEVNLNSIIDAVFISPTAPSWFAEVVTDLRDKYSLDAPVCQSDLNQTPVY